MIKRFISAILIFSVLIAAFPSEFVFADGLETSEIANRYIKVVVNNKNGGYVISTLEGDILKKSDNNAALTHRGENYDTSFTSFKIGDDEYVFGENYGIFASDTTDTVTERDVNGNYIKSTWSIKDYEIEQNISLVNSDTSEQLGTAMITYTVKNNSASDKSIKSRVLIDTQLGENDFGYYEVPKQKLGQGYEYFEFEKTWDSSKDATVTMPSDYFVRDNPYSSNIVGYGINSVFTEQKPYKMTFAHWANIASTVFDYEPDNSLNFTNNFNAKKTADSAAALYYNLGTVAAGDKKSFSTYYGVTANLKNKDNKIIMNTTAPSKLEFTDDLRTAYKGSDGEDNIVRINVNLTNPLFADKNYKNLAVAVYSLGFDAQRQTDAGNWIVYDNKNPIHTDIVNFYSGENRVTYFDFKFTPQERAQLGSFIIKVFDMDEQVNELGYYAEDYCLATSENHIILPGRDKTLPPITLTDLSPGIIYNQDVRYITVTGKGTNLFESPDLDKIYLYGDDGTNYEIPTKNLIFDRNNNSSSVSIMLEEYMKPGKYQLHFIWKNSLSLESVGGIPSDFTSDAMTVQISSDKKYYNTAYGVVTVQRDGKEKYKIVPYRTEDDFKKADIKEDNLLLSLRGDIRQDKDNKNFYRLFGKDKDVNINYILNYNGDDFTLEQKDNGTVNVLMDGKITTVGANTTVRNGTAAFRLNSGIEYVIPEYDEDGSSDTQLVGNQDYIELKWDNAFDVLTTVGGFLIDMKYGVLGRIKNDNDTTSNIISFGGNLDLAFMTPGGAAAVRQNTAAGARWTTDLVEDKYDDNDDGYTFGITFDENEGVFKTQTKEKDIPPANEDAERVEAGAAIHDILFGGKDPGYIGINMDAHIALPQIVKFLPNKVEGNLSINTIGGYEVGVDANVDLANVSLGLSFVVKESPNGAPVPDKLYFSIGGFEPGINVDNLGVVWVTGGGGGIDNLYDTIYGKDGIPPVTVLLHVEFDITKILTGNADLELSLRSLKIAFDDLSLKMLKNAKFLEGGEIAVGWYPNFNLNLSAGVNFADIMKGNFTITAAAGKDTADFVQFVLNVAIGLPGYIPIVGGMELASAELGGGSQKVWGAVEVLSLIKVGFTYYWGGSIEFTHGSPSGNQNFAALSSTDDDGVKRTKLMYNEMLKPIEVGENTETGEKQFASVGTNLAYCAGSTAVSDFDERVKNANNENNENNAGIKLMGLDNFKSEVFTNNDRTNHLITFGETSDYILSISPAESDTKLSADELKKSMTVKQNGSLYELRYYTAPNHNASDKDKKDALNNANINVTENAAYIAVPKSNSLKNMLIEFSDGKPYDVSVIKVNPISTLNSNLCKAQVNGNVINIEWDGENISDTAKIIISATDGNEQNSIVLNNTEILAASKMANVPIPEKMSSGEYNIIITLSDEDTVYESFNVGKVNITNINAPSACKNAAIQNCGNGKLKINVDANDDDFDGYLVEVYEGDTLADTGLYFKKGEEIIVGGQYEMPVLDENGKPVLLVDENGKTVLDENNNPKNRTITVGYTPEKEYSAKVRRCNIKKDSDGNEVYYCSAYKTTQKVKLNKTSQPSVHIEYNKNDNAIKVVSDVPVTGELYINYGSDSGEWYSYSENTNFSQPVKLADGEYTVEFNAVDKEGDSAIVSEIIKIDTTAPVIMLASPQNGDTFQGDSITVTATAESNAEYVFKINEKEVTPQESDIFTNGMLKCTLPLGDAKKLAKINLEITAKDSVGNKTVKNLTLTNKSVSLISAISVLSDDKTAENGKIVLCEGESTYLRVFGLLPNNDKIDVTDMNAAKLEIAGGTSAGIDGTKVTAAFAGQTMIRAVFDIGGGEYLYDGVIIDSIDNTLNYSALKEVIDQANQITNNGYTDSSWNNLQNAVKGAQQVLKSSGVTQSDIDNAATAVSNAIAELKTNNSGSNSSGGRSSAYYTVSFNTNGGSTVQAQKLRSAQKVVKPDDPVKDGYTFGGWYADKHLTTPYDFTLGVTKSFTIYAKWIENQSIIEPSDWVNPFTDVKTDDWYFDYVKYVNKNGLMSGTSSNIFEPDGLLTRGMLVTVLYRAEGEPAVNRNVPFADVDKADYYSNAVTWAWQNKIVNGFTENEFAPNENITREQIAAIIYRYAKYKGYNTSESENTNIFSYADFNNISEYAITAMQYAVGSQLLKGRTETILNPADNATRAEIAAILQRFIDSEYMHKT